MAINTVLSPPIPPFQNLPIQAQYYEPSRFVITAITLGPTTTVTTSVNHNYVVGQQVRLIIPPSFGCSGLNDKDGFVIAIPNPNQVIINISSIGNNTFIVISAKTQAQILAIGDVNSGPINANGINPTTTFIPGSFINISPA
jgi:hypothetical protein